ncbi:hypothetical protein V8G57_17055 [Collimonas sp. H4R21]|uniref:Uncharacterized protein n=1 Tax=Collimonas rhizosphaerae TaxID=3126357 RepID=A0ABU9PYN0_9BURK
MINSSLPQTLSTIRNVPSYANQPKSSVAQSNSTPENLSAQQWDPRRQYAPDSEVIVDGKKYRATSLIEQYPRTSPLDNGDVWLYAGQATPSEKLAGAKKEAVDLKNQLAMETLSAGADKLEKLVSKSTSEQLDNKLSEIADLEKQLATEKFSAEADKLDKLAPKSTSEQLTDRKKKGEDLKNQLAMETLSAGADKLDELAPKSTSEQLDDKLNEIADLEKQLATEKFSAGADKLDKLAPKSTSEQLDDKLNEIADLEEQLVKEKFSAEADKLDKLAPKSTSEQLTDKKKKGADLKNQLAMDTLSAGVDKLEKLVEKSMPENLSAQRWDPRQQYAPGSEVIVDGKKYRATSLIEQYPRTSPQDRGDVWWYAGQATPSEKLASAQKEAADLGNQLASETLSTGADKLEKLVEKSMPENLSAQRWDPRRQYAPGSEVIVDGKKYRATSLIEQYPRTSPQDSGDVWWYDGQATTSEKLASAQEEAADLKIQLAMERLSSGVDKLEKLVPKSASEQPDNKLDEIADLEKQLAMETTDGLHKIGNPMPESTSKDVS